MSSLGYATPAAKFAAMMLSGVVAGRGRRADASGTRQFMSPSAAGFEVSAMAVIIIIIGGVGAPLGPLIGAALVVGIEHWLSSYVERWPTLLGLLFIAVVILMPPRGGRRVLGLRAPTGPGAASRGPALLGRSAASRTTCARTGEVSSADLADGRGRHQEG